MPVPVQGHYSMLTNKVERIRENTRSHGAIANATGQCALHVLTEKPAAKVLPQCPAVERTMVRGFLVHVIIGDSDADTSHCGCVMLRRTIAGTSAIPCARSALAERVLRCVPAGRDCAWHAGALRGPGGRACGAEYRRREPSINLFVQGEVFDAET